MSIKKCADSDSVFQTKKRKLTEPLKNCLRELAKLKNASLNELSKLKKPTPNVIELGKKSLKPCAGSSTVLVFVFYF